MEMNTITQERVAGKVLAALKEEGLMNKEAAEIFGFSPTYMSMIVRSSTYTKVPRKAWEAMHDWAQLGTPLKEFKSPLRQEADPTPEMTPAPDKAVPESIPASEPQKDVAALKQEIAAAFRNDYEQAQKVKPEPVPDTKPDDETITISREGKKVDLSKINMRTGALVTFEVFDNEIHIRILR